MEIKYSLYDASRWPEGQHLVSQSLPLLDNKTPCAAICPVQPSRLRAGSQLSFQMLAKEGAALLEEKT